MTKKEIKACSIIIPAAAMLLTMLLGACTPQDLLGTAPAPNPPASGTTTTPAVQQPPVVTGTPPVVANQSQTCVPKTVPNGTAISCDFSVVEVISEGLIQGPLNIDGRGTPNQIQGYVLTCQIPPAGLNALPVTYEAFVASYYASSSTSPITAALTPGSDYSIGPTPTGRFQEGASLLSVTMVFQNRDNAPNHMCAN